MTLAGLIKHLAFVEDGFTATAHGRPLGPPWDTRGWAEEWQVGLAVGVTDEPAELYALWYGAVERCRNAWTEMIEGDGLDVTVEMGGPDYIVSRRRILVDLLEEDLLHTGHASLLREAVDGLTGNDPPPPGQST